MTSLKPLTPTVWCNRMAGLKVSDSVTGEERKVPMKGLFYGVGHNPNTYARALLSSLGENRLTINFRI
jgi:alkyl hydroperoxide reductase subunit AhpF